MKDVNYVVWITGLSCAGKTTLANALRQSMLQDGCNCILLDGDELRWALGCSNTEYSVDERKKLAFCYARMASLLSKQGFYVIVAAVAMFEDVRLWNRANNDKYCEIYLKVDKNTRISRDINNMYNANFDLVEFDYGFDEPKNPDIIFDGSYGLDKMVGDVKVYLTRELATRQFYQQLNL